MYLILFLFLILILFCYIYKINIKTLKKIKDFGRENKDLDEIVKKYPSNIEICKFMLKKLKNDSNENISLLKKELANKKILAKKYLYSSMLLGTLSLITASVKLKISSSILGSVKTSISFFVIVLSSKL